MKKPLRVLAGLMALGLAGVGSATAQGVYFNGPGFYGPRYFYYGPRYYAPGLSLSQVTRIVRSAGITTVGAPIRRGRTYVVAGIDRGGNRVRVVVDAYEGVIVSVRPVVALRQFRAPVPPRDPRLAVVPDEEPVVPGPTPGSQAAAPSAAGSVPLPPQPTPNRQVARAPATTGAIAALPAQASRTPVPRPRPMVAANTQPAAASPAVTATPVEAPPHSRPPTQMVPVAPLD